MQAEKKLKAQVLLKEASALLQEGVHTDLAVPTVQRIEKVASTQVTTCKSLDLDELRGLVVCQ